jgi:UDP-N-acetylmuramoylalanine--D-glutamate ligase
MIPVSVFLGRDVAVFGLGMSGVAAARSLTAGGARVFAWDDGEAARDKAQAAGVALADLRDINFKRFAALVLAPGVPLTHPEPHWTVARAHEAGVEVIGDTELFFRQKAADRSQAKVIAITGTNGKSTTTALTAHLLKESGRRVAMGGNIGTATLDLDPFADDLIYVLEFSSFQIDLTPSLAPDAAALLNITPDHIDRHGDIGRYAAIKARMFDRMGAGRDAVIGVDDAHSAAIADAVEAKESGIAVWRVRAGRRLPDASGVWFEDAALHETLGDNEFSSVDLAGIPSLRGAHNWQNAAVAYALALSQAVDLDDARPLAAAFRTFPGLAHRMEQVGRSGRVIFVNDSKATNADAAAKALASFDPIYWIVGGRPKEGGLAGLEEFHPRIAKTYLIGESSDAFAAQLGDRVPFEHCGTLDRAVEAAARDAASSAADEPVVLLSPACASYDQFANYAERGQAFRRAVAQAAGEGGARGAAA